MKDFEDLVEKLLKFIDILVPFLIAITFAVVMWKVIDAWVTHSDDPSKRSDGQMAVVVGVVAVVVMIIVWGIVDLVASSVF
ncbi:hypothetical protein KC723_03495 [Candidatus Kaiserbacteria bacterium]|nr:hypothetical protein [Candidatus Kaiserbacteria bacterium]